MSALSELRALEAELRFSACTDSLVMIADFWNVTEGNDQVTPPVPHYGFCPLCYIESVRRVAAKLADPGMRRALHEAAVLHLNDAEPPDEAGHARHAGARKARA